MAISRQQLAKELEPGLNALASLISSLELACINSILPTLSSFSFDELNTAVPVLTVPE